METKIIFNGKTYTSVGSMPDDVRQAYQQALAHLEDADKNGIPDILERGAKGNVIAIQQSSINFNGKEYKTVGEMPALVRRLFVAAAPPRRRLFRYGRRRDFSHAQDGRRLTQPGRQILRRHRRAHYPWRRGLAISQAGRASRAVQHRNDRGGKALRLGQPSATAALCDSPFWCGVVFALIHGGI
jgi:hypothetical protein